MIKKLPQDTDTTIYIEDLGYSLDDLINFCHNKWGKDKKWGPVYLSNLKITFQEIQIKCFGYDQYDPGDYKYYFVITLGTPINV